MVQPSTEAFGIELPYAQSTGILFLHFLNGRLKNLHYTVASPEPTLGSLVEYNGLRKINVRGKAGANKVMLMAAVAFNFKEYMKITTKSTASQAIALKMEWSLASQNTFLGFAMLFLN